MKNKLLGAKASRNRLFALISLVAIVLLLVLNLLITQIGLKKTLFTKPAQLVFEMEVLESTDDKLSLDFHYCPLVKAWQNAGCSDEEIAELCDIAMCGDHGIGECYGAVLDLPKCIAKGDDVCSLRYHKK